MKNIRINYRTNNPSLEKIKKFIGSFSSKNNVSFKVFDFSASGQIPTDDSFFYEKIQSEYSTATDYIVSQSRDCGADICAVFNNNVEFVGNLDEIIEEFDDFTGCVYSDYISDGTYVYLKSPPVNNMTAVLLFINLLKVESQENIIESIFSSNAAKHIPEALCLVSNE